MTVQLITGSTGFMGSHLAVRLLEDENTTIVAIARGKGAASARERFVAAIQKALVEQGAGSEHTQRILDRAAKTHVVDSDLGSLPGDFDFQDRIDRIWHIAAMVDFSEAKRADTRYTNVNGTANLLSLATERSIPSFVYVSTAYVVGVAGGVVGAEEPISSMPNNPYEASKREAEHLVEDWGKVPGRTTHIMRPSIIVAPRRTKQTFSPYGLYGFLTMMYKLWGDINSKMPEFARNHPIRILVEPQATLNLIPVDDVVELAISLASPNRPSGIFHLCNPKPPLLEDVIRAIATSMDGNFEAGHQAAELSPIDDLLNKYTDQFQCYLKNSKTFSMRSELELASKPAEFGSISKDELVDYISTHFDKLARNRESKRGGGFSIARSLTRKTLAVDSKEILPYYVGGEGSRNLVFVNAYGQSIAFWDKLASRFHGDCRIVVWQARGTTSGNNGLSNFYPLMSHVEDLRRIVEAEGIETCTIVGWCTGPKLAIEYCNKFPASVERMVFVTGAFKGTPGSEDLATTYERNMEPLCQMVDDDPSCVPALIDTLRAIMVGKSGSTEGEVNRRVTENLSLINRSLQSLVIEPFLTENSVISYARQLLDFWKHDVSDKLASIKAPTLVVAGEHDNIASSEISRLISSKIPGSAYVEIRSGTHYPHYDNHELLCGMIDNFTNGREATAGHPEALFSSN